MSGVLPAALEELMEMSSPQATVLRTASGFQGLQPLACRVQVGKGNRQILSRTLGEGLALRVGYRDPCLNIKLRWNYSLPSWLGVVMGGSTLARHGAISEALHVRWATGSELKQTAGL
jgi:hypothetical protein